MGRSKSVLAWALAPGEGAGACLFAPPGSRGLAPARGPFPRGMRPPFSFWSCPKRECAAPGGREKGAWSQLCTFGAKLLYGGRRIGACSDLVRPSGTLSSSARSILPSRGGWCGGRRGARTHLTSFSFTVSRCGAPSISVTSVPLVPPSARSASLRAAWAVGEAPDASSARW